LRYNNDEARLLETLIKMVGKSNQKVDSLQRRVNQLELFIREQMLDQGAIHIHPTHPPITHTRILS
jgi:hypothetical protein